MRQGFTLEEALKAVSKAENQNGCGGVNICAGNAGGTGVVGKREKSALEREMEAKLASGMSAEEVKMLTSKIIISFIESIFLLLFITLSTKNLSSCFLTVLC